MKSTIPILVFSLLLSGCQTEQAMRDADKPSKENELISALIWVEKADATRDAEAAIARGDKALLGLATRGTRIPGIEPEDQDAAIKQCGIRLLDGTGDAIFGDRQLKLLQKVQQYAETYNRIIFQSYP